MFQRKRRAISYWSGIVGGIFMLTFFIIIGRFVFIAQGKEIDGHSLIQLGTRQWTEVKIVDEKRGTIYSSNGSILAEDVPAYTLYAVISPKAAIHVIDKEKTASELAPILKMKESDLFAALNRKAYQVEFGSKGRMLSFATKQKIDSLKLPGINYLTESKRYYPEQSSAAYTIGFTQTNPDNNQQKGVFGVEQSMDRYLTEKDGSVRYYTSSGGVPIPDEKQKINKPVPGDNVYLTLNSSIQTVLDQTMSRVNADYKPNSMIGIVADPKTGKILAMSTYPDFNPNLRDIKQFSNIAIASPYEPGSVMKTFTVASAIDAGVFNGKATYASGDYRVKGGTIHDWNRAGWGTINFDQAFELSSNVGMSVLTDKYLGPDRLGTYLKKFGFMQKTGIDLPGEQAGIVNWTWPIDKLEASFGQGSAFTAMQIVQASTAVANNGVMMRPYVVDKVVNPENGKTVLANHPVVSGHPVSASAAEQTRALMRQVITNKNVVNGVGATGTAFDLPGYDVIGKTGTAQIAMNGQYLVGKNNYVYSFLGMAPQNNPRVIVYVAIKQPHLKPTDLGSEPVVDIARPVMTSSLQYLQVDKKVVQGNGQKAAPSVKLGDYAGQPLDQTVRSLQSFGLNPIALGDSPTVSRQFPYPGEELEVGSKVILYSGGTVKMPNIQGWSLADAMKLTNIADLKLNTQGYGFVDQQKPSPGTQLKSGDTLTIDMKPSLQMNIQTSENKGNNTGVSGVSPQQ